MSAQRRWWIARDSTSWHIVRRRASVSKPIQRMPTVADDLVITVVPYRTRCGRIKDRQAVAKLATHPPGHPCGLCIRGIKVA